MQALAFLKRPFSLALRQRTPHCHEHLIPTGRASVTLACHLALLHVAHGARLEHAARPPHLDHAKPWHHRLELRRTVHNAAAEYGAQPRRSHLRAAARPGDRRPHHATARPVHVAHHHPKTSRRAELPVRAARRLRRLGGAVGVGQLHSCRGDIIVILCESAHLRLARKCAVWQALRLCRASEPSSRTGARLHAAQLFGHAFLGKEALNTVRCLCFGGGKGPVEG